MTLILNQCCKKQSNLIFHTKKLSQILEWLHVMFSNCQQDLDLKMDFCLTFQYVSAIESRKTSVVLFFLSNSIIRSIYYNLCMLIS